MIMKDVIASSDIEEGSPPDKLDDRFAAGVLQAEAHSEDHKIPLVDGGEGFTEILVRATAGTSHVVKVTGPLGYEIEAEFGFLGTRSPKTAVLDVAAAAGLRLIPRDQRDPLQTTTYGVGELIKTALGAGAESLLIGCGDSISTDGGAGMAQALGISLLDVSGQQIAWGGGALAKLIRIDMTNVDARIHKVKTHGGCNWNSILCGPRGIARIFSSQKGASSEVGRLLAVALENYADVIQGHLGIDVRTMPGGGAGGGLGTALHVFLNATLRSPYDLLKQYLEFKYSFEPERSRHHRETLY